MNDHDLTDLIPPAAAGGAGRGWRCPDEARLAAFVEGTLSNEAREGVTLHLAGCAFCRGQVGFLVRAKQFGPPPTVPGHLLALARGKRSWWAGRLRPAIAVAAVLGMALAAVLVTSRGRQGLLPSKERLSGAAIATPSGIVPEGSVRTRHGTEGSPRIVRPVEGESMPRNAVELRWEETSGALFYTVQLVDSKGDVVWEGRTEGAHLTVPPGATLVPGEPYFAWVLAHLRSGATVRSLAVSFQLARE